MSALNQTPLDNLERATSYNTLEIVDYVAGQLVSGRLISKTTGTVTIVACDAGVKAVEKISPFDTLVQVIDGDAEITIDHKTHRLMTGQCIVLPAHFRSIITSKARFKVLLTVIKSGYEDSI